MKMTFAIPDPVAARFRAIIPHRQRSAVVTELLRNKLGAQENALAAACRTVNANEKLTAEDAEWEKFDDEAD